jgi:hypothetical protein
VNATTPSGPVLVLTWSIPSYVSDVCTPFNCTADGTVPYQYGYGFGGCGTIRIVPPGPTLHRTPPVTSISLIPVVALLLRTDVAFPRYFIDAG